MRKKAIIKNLNTNILLHIVTIIYGFILPKIIISTYGSEINGLVSSITQFLGYIVLLEAGVGPVIKSILYKAIAKNNKEEISSILLSSEKFFRKIALIFLIYVLILFIIYPFIISSNFNSIYTISLIMIISISLFSEYFFGITYKLFIEASQKAYVVNIFKIISYIISIFLVLFLSSINASIHILKLSVSLVFLIRSISINRYVKQKYKLKLDKEVKEYNLKQKWDALAQHIAYVVHTNTDITILTIFKSLKEVSVYAVYLLVLKGIKSIVQIFTSSVDAIFGDMIAQKEKKNLREKFELYEISYFTLIAIIYTCTLILIIPFITIYTNNVHDINYIRPMFALLIVLSELVWAIRLPYNLLNANAGRFKETKKGAILEALINIIISIVLVNYYGIIGVAIGTLIAMAIRTIEFVYQVNKYEET